MNHCQIHYAVRAFPIDKQQWGQQFMLLNSQFTINCTFTWFTRVVEKAPRLICPLTLHSEDFKDLNSAQYEGVTPTWSKAWQNTCTKNFDICCAIDFHSDSEAFSSWI